MPALKGSNITIRLPQAIHDRLREVARQDRRSVTSLILILIETGLPRFRFGWTSQSSPESVRAALED